MRGGAAKSGFTIVELLIVVVVIAILAAITIVAYNGIQNRAKTSAVQSAASQAGRKIATYAVTNSDTYPASLTLAGLTTPSNVQYDYFIDTSARKYCVSATTNTISYAQTQTSSNIEGRCMTNYAINPSAEGATNLLVSAGAPTLTISTDSFSGWPTTGSRSFKVTATTAGETRQRPQNNTIPLVTTDPVQASFSIRNAAASAKSFYVSFQGRTSGGAVTALYNTSSVSIPANSTARVSGVLPIDQYATTFSTAAFVEPMISRSATGGAVGDLFYIDDVFVSYGDTLKTYGDGSSANWAWTGADYDSTSFGPLP